MEWKTHCSSPQDVLSAPSLSHMSHWAPPAAGRVKLNCDGSFSPPLSSDSVEIVVRSDDGSLIDGIARKIPVISPLASEAWAVRDACLLVLSSGWSNAI